ncbi:TonB-dependent receptor [candidate division KSB1 bacterium]|nr:TonB-dependent receptor [candidate division KSB1 bacterium]
MLRKLMHLFLLILLVPALVSGATVGKITGKIVDRESGDALPGANVTIPGTTLGAASDVNGDFVILNVPVGTYTLKAEFIGYRAVEITEVRVNSGLTTEINFDLPVEALAVDAISIVAERPLVNKNATNAVRIQSYDEMKNVPVRGVGAVVALQPGVVAQDGNLYIRGGRNDEVGYTLEGANTRDPVYGKDLAVVIPEALEEFQVQAGGFNAEFGGANAGIVSRTLKAGSEQYQLSFQAETDNFADEGEKFLDTYSYGYSNYTMTASGPVPGLNNKLKFFLAGDNLFQRDRIARFWNGFDFNNADSYIDENNFPLVTEVFGEVLADGIHSPDGNIPQTMMERWTGNGTLVYDANPFTIRLGTAFSWQRQQDIEGQHNQLQSPNLFARLGNLDRVGLTDRSTALINLKVTHLVNPTTFYELNLNGFDSRRLSYDPLLGENFFTYWDSLANAEAGVTFTNWASPLAGNTRVVNGFGLTVPGTPQNYVKGRQNYISGSLNFTTQWNRHEIKAGGSMELWRTREFHTLERNIFTNMVNNPDQFRDAVAGDEEALSQVMFSAGWYPTYGYDVFGNELNDDGIDGPREPQYYAAYLQDKFELSDLVINAGIRMDYIDNDDFHFVDPLNPPWNVETGFIEEDAIVLMDPDISVSPRLGLAFPATDNTVFHVQYGKFVQAPRLNDIYTGQAFYQSLFTGGFFFSRPVGFGLKPEKTTQYELGLNHQFAENASFDLTVFYKEVNDQIQPGRVLVALTSRAASYNILQNGDFATTKGIELALNLRRTNRFAGQLNYTFSNALGTGSTPFSAIAGTSANNSTPTIVQPLDFNQKHRGTVNIDYRFAKGDGNKLLEQMGANVLFTFNSGHPYTRAKGNFGQQAASTAGVITDSRSRIPLESVNSSITPWNYQIDLRLDKSLHVGRLDLNVYFYAQNLTNRRNVINVYERTGNAWDDGFLAAPEISQSIIAAHGGDAYIAMHNAINLNGNGVNYENNYGNLLFGTPRQLRFGVRLGL